MSRTRSPLVMSVLLCGLLAGCGTAVADTPAPSAPVAHTVTAPAAGSVAVTGDVRTPTVLTPEVLARYPQKSVPVVYRSGTGREAHVFRGALLSDILPTSAPAPAPGKNAFLQFAVLAKAADGYSAVVSYGEFSPDFGNTPVLVATVQDGRKLDRPRLVVPGDGKGGRYVSDLTELKVARVAP